MADIEQMKRQAKSAREWAEEARRVSNPSKRLLLLADAKERHADYLDGLIEEREAARVVDEQAVADIRSDAGYWA